MNFGEVFTRAWEIIWKHKILWIFGLLVSLAGGSGGGSGSSYRFSSSFNNNGNFRTPFPGLERFFQNIPAWLIILFVLLMIFLVIVLIIISTLGRAGLIRGAWRADSGESKLAFGQLFSESTHYFWRVLLLGFLMFVLSISLVFLILIPTVLAAALTFGIAIICLLPLICLLVPVFIALGVLFDLATIATVGEDLGIMDGVHRAWQVFSTHLAEIIGVGLIVVIGSAVIAFIIGLPSLAIAAPIFAAAFSQNQRVMFGGAAIALVLFILYLPILLAVRAILTSYVETTWTVTYRRLTGRVPGSNDLIEVPPQPVI